MSEHSDRRLQDAPVLAALRAGTRTLHAAVEARPAMAGLLGDALTPAAYAACLSRLAGFHAALEPSVETWLGATAGLDLPDRRKLPLLLDDTRTVGGDAPRPMTPFVWTTEAEAWGALYVTEGATLGGAVISRHLGRHAWLGAPSGRRYFLGYGRHTGARWTAFRQALVGACAGRAVFIAEAVDAARTVFARLDAHMDEGADETTGKQVAPLAMCSGAGPVAPCPATLASAQHRP